MTKKEKFLQQIALQNKAYDAGVNIVTCGDCGHTLLAPADAEQIQCPHCDFTADQCDFPDLFYTGMEVHEVERNEQGDAFVAGCAKCGSDVYEINEKGLCNECANSDY